MFVAVGPSSEVVEVPESIVIHSSLINNIISDIPGVGTEEYPIPMESADLETMNLIIKWLVDDELVINVEQQQDQIAKLITLTNYLNIKKLYDHCLTLVADLIRDISMNDLRNELIKK